MKCHLKLHIDITLQSYQCLINSYLVFWRAERHTDTHGQTPLKQHLLRQQQQVVIVIILVILTSRFAGEYDVTFSWTNEWRARLDVLRGPDVIVTVHSGRLSHTAVSWCSGWTSHDDGQASSTGASSCSHLHHHHHHHRDRVLPQATTTRQTNKIDERSRASRNIHGRCVTLTFDLMTLKNLTSSSTDQCPPVWLAPSFPTLRMHRQPVITYY